MIKLEFITEFVATKQFDYIPLKIIRLIANVQFLKSDIALSKVYNAIVDTGAPTSVLPAYIWKDIKFTLKTDRAKLIGITDSPQCQIEANIANVAAVLLDNDGNRTETITIPAFLARLTVLLYY